MQQDDSLVRGQTSSSAGCQLHILSPCHLQEHPLNFLGKYKYVFVVFRTSSTSSSLFLHSLQSIIHPSACSIHLDFLSIVITRSYSLAYDAPASLQLFAIPPSAKCHLFQYFLQTFSDLAYDWSSPVSFCFFISWGTTHMVIYCCYCYWLILGKLC